MAVWSQWNFSMAVIRMSIISIYKDSSWMNSPLACHLHLLADVTLDCDGPSRGPSEAVGVHDVSIKAEEEYDIDR